MNPVETVRRYVSLSNQGDVDAIAELIDEHAVYSSQNVGIHYKKQNILEMKRRFFGGLRSQHWEVKEYTETMPGVVQYEFWLEAMGVDGSRINKSGSETVIVNSKGKIVYVDVRNSDVI